MLERLNKFNFVSSLISYLNCLSLLITGNFRCNESYTIHSFGAVSLFVGILLYGYYMTYISYNLASKFKIESKPFTMSIAMVIGVVSLLGCVIFNAISVFQFGYQKYFDDYSRLHWSSAEPGYRMHILGTGFEWITINLFSLLYLCFFRRMKMFSDWNKVQF